MYFWLTLGKNRCILVLEVDIMKNTKDSKKIFAKNLSNLMKERNITRKNLSEELNIKYSTLCEWLKGTMMPRSEALDLITEYFQITSAELFSTEDELKQFIKAPLLVYLKPELSFEDNLIQNNHGYVLADTQNQFAVKVIGETNASLSIAENMDTIIFDRVNIKQYNELELTRVYYIRRNNNEGEIVRYINGKDNEIGIFIPLWNQNNDYSIIQISEENNLEIHGIAVAMIKRF